MKCRLESVKYDADAFCHICGIFIKVRDIKFYLNACEKLCEAYETYFNCPVRNLDKPWAPHVACNNCKRYLEGKQFLVNKKYVYLYKYMFIICLFLSLFISGWYRGEKRSMKFAVPRIWREPNKKPR